MEIGFKLKQETTSTIPLSLSLSHKIIKDVNLKKKEGISKNMYSRDLNEKQSNRKYKHIEMKPTYFF